MSGQFAQISEVLTAIAVNYKSNKKLIGNEVAPVVRVPSEEFKYPRWDKKGSFKIPNTALSRAGKIPQIEFSRGLVSGSVSNKGISTLIPLQDIEIETKNGNATFVSTLTEKTVDVMMRRKEVEVARAAQDAKNYGTNKKDYTAANSWASSNCDPILEIRNAIDKSIITFNRMWIANDAFSVLVANPNVIKYFAGTGEKIFVTAEMLASLIGLDKILIGNTRYNISEVDEAATYSSAWTGKAGLFLYDQPASANTAETFMFDGYWSPNGNIRDVTELDIMNQGRMGVKEVSVRETSDVHSTSTEFGYLFNNVMAA